MTLDIIFNLSLLVSLSLISGFIQQKRSWPRWLPVVLQGLLFGTAALVGMLRPLVLGPGLIFDGRSVMISLCALFFGSIAGGLSALMALVLRLHIGGPGALMGVLVILSSLLAGLLARRIWTPDRNPPSVAQLYLLGLAVHAAMVALMGTLPAPLAGQVVARLGLPVMVFYPLATVLAGRILADQVRMHRRLAELEKTRSELKVLLDSIGDAVLATDRSGRIQFINPIASQLTGWSENEALGRPLEEVFDIINEETRLPVETPVARVLRESCVVGLANHTLLRSREGAVRAIADSAAPIRTSHPGGDEVVSGVVLVFRDQTEERLHGRALRLRLKMLGLMRELNARELLRVGLAEACTLMGGDRPRWLFLHNQIWHEVTEVLEGETWSGSGMAVPGRPVLPEEMEPVWKGCVASGVPGTQELSGDRGAVLQVVPVVDQTGVQALLGVRRPSPGLTALGSEQELVYLAELLWELVRQKATEEALALSESRYEAFVNASGDMFSLRDEHHRLVMVNRGFADFFSRKPEELVGLRYPDFMDPSVANMLENQGRRVLERHRMEISEEVLNGVPFESMQFPVRMGPKVYAGGILRNIAARKAAENALGESQRMYVSLVNNLPGFVYRCLADRNWTMLYVSEGCARITGYQPSALIENRDLAFNDLIDPSCQEAIWQKWQTALETRTVFEGEYPIHRSDGVVRWVWERGNGVWDENGSLQFLEGFITDITERKHALNALSRSESYLKSILESSNDGVVVHDAHTGAILTVNRAMEEMFGYKAEAFSRLDIGDISEGIEPYRQEDALFWLEKARSEGPQTFTWHSRRQDGTLFWSEVSARYGLLGEEACFVVLVRDITSRKQIELALRASESRHRRLFETMTQGVIYLNGSGGVIRVNPAAYDILERAGLEMTTESIDVWMPLWASDDSEGAEPVEHPALLAQRTGQSMGPLVLLLGRDGGPEALWLRLWATPVFDTGEPEPSAIYLMFEDITARRRADEEREQLQQQLLHAQKMESVGRLAGGVAHDFNNMLGVILGHADMALNHTALDQGVVHDLNEIRQAALRSADLTRRLLAFARKQEVQPQKLDLNRSVDSLQKMLARILGEDILLTWNPGQGSMQVQLDPSQLDQVLANLVVNARDAILSASADGDALARGGGHVVIRTGREKLRKPLAFDWDDFRPGAYITLEVEDNGPGLSEKAKSHLFEPFFTTKESGKGTGLGLSTVYGIVRQNRGFVLVGRGGEGGALFRMFFPALEREEETEQGQTGRERPLQTGRETLLLVEDEPSILDLGRMMLEGLGYQVLPAGGPLQALEIARAWTDGIDLVVTDVIMPDMNGRELVQALRGERPGLRCLYMSGYTDDVIARHGVLDEGLFFLQKPFSRKELATKVRQVLDHPFSPPE